MRTMTSSSAPARDKVNPVYSPIEFERRRKAEIRKQARMDEAETDDFANNVQAYAHFNGKNAQEELDREKRYRRTGKGGNPGLRLFLEQGKRDQNTGDAKNAPKPPKPAAAATVKKTQPGKGFQASLNKSIVPKTARSAPATAGVVVGSAGGFALGLVTYGLIISGVKYGTAGVRAYASAKLFNKVLAGPWGGTPSTSSSTTPTQAPAPVAPYPGGPVQSPSPQDVLPAPAVNPHSIPVPSPNPVPLPGPPIAAPSN
jgi:hypothetical protein